MIFQKVSAARPKIQNFLSAGNFQISYTFSPNQAIYIIVLKTNNSLRKTLFGRELRSGKGETGNYHQTNNWQLSGFGSITWIKNYPKFITKVNSVNKFKCIINIMRTLELIENTPGF